MKTRSAKAKGRKLQNLVASTVLAQYPDLTKNDVRPCQMGGTGVDIQLSEAARKKFPFAVECKNQEKVQIWQAIQQAEENAKQENLVPAIVISRNRMPEPYVMIPLSVWFLLIKHAEKEINNNEDFDKCLTSRVKTDKNSTPL